MLSIAREAGVPQEIVTRFFETGITAPRAMHAKRLGIDPQTISKRLLRGFSMRAALTQLPPRVSMRTSRASCIGAQPRLTRELHRLSLIPCAARCREV
jgi:hypothetical protein